MINQKTKHSMYKKLSFLVMLIIFAGINLQSLTTDIAQKKIEDIMKATTTDTHKQYYFEVTPNAQAINTYNTTHELIASYPISNRVKELLNKKDATEAEQEEADFTVCLFGAKWQLRPLGEKNLEQNRKKQAHLVGKILGISSGLITGIGMGPMFNKGSIPHSFAL